MMGTDSASRIEELNGLDHLTGKDVAFVSAAQRCTKNEVKGLAGSRIWRLERKKTYTCWWGRHKQKVRKDAEGSFPLALSKHMEPPTIF